MGQEVELKLELDGKDAQALAGDDLLRDVDSRSERLVSVYYDTRGGKLRKNGYSLRVRSTPDGYVQTLKSLESSSGLFFRGEWESPVDSIEPHAETLASTPAGEVGAKKLVPVVRSTVERTSWRVTDEGNELEIALDDGDVRAEGRDQPLCELEIELKRGKAEAAFHAARELATRLPLRLGVMSKAERGFALADDSLGKVAKAQPLPLNAEMSVAEGFALIVQSCIRHFRLNEPLVLGDQNPNALHQARVAMRRLRSALSLFRPAVGDGEYDRLREELRWFTAQLGDARNLDVYLSGELSKPERKRLLGQRKQAYADVVETLNSKRLQLLLIDLMAWVSIGGWRSGKRAARPLPEFAGSRISRLWLKISSHGDLGAMDDEERHQLRIEIKKLRYALDFMQPLYARAAARQKQFTRAIEALQESLGRLNDIVTARSLASDDGAEPGPNRHGDEVTRCIRHAVKCFNRLKLIGPYWIRIRSPAAT